MDLIFWILALLCVASAFAAVSRIIKNYNIREKGGVANSPIRDQRFRNKRR